ncbi:hypothetical protein, partial [Lactococcus petauri]|uniref:hypothetical protein n=1 Tax=Lactococcus petauri TaxID=1940789 RepID=UPI0021F16A65
DAYKLQGALSDIMIDLEGAVGKPRFETSIEGYVTAIAINPNGIPLLGKPDIFFLTKKGATVIFDWKVNGYCSNYNKSPSAGYIRIRTNDP